ncbi:sugar transferase [uncultured Sphingomonas sp.]|uniref:sugar transferase n=1 Tax=uncultured Sphingomonas sp. TaxID=158754 RepID=UPI0035C9487E
MIRPFKHYVPHATMLPELVGAVCLMLACGSGWVARSRRIGIDAGSIAARVTRIGRFIRRVQINEPLRTRTVPKGGMSFLSPRPDARSALLTLFRTRRVRLWPEDVR